MYLVTLIIFRVWAKRGKDGLSKTPRGDGSLVSSSGKPDRKFQETRRWTVGGVKVEETETGMFDLDVVS